MKPQRIQRKRTSGWRKPENTVIIDRTSQYGKNYTVKDYGRDECIELFKKHQLPKISQRDLDRLRGKDLACTCKLDEACHGDVMLEIVNQHNP